MLNSRIDKPKDLGLQEDEPQREPATILSGLWGFG